MSILQKGGNAPLTTVSPDVRIRIRRGGITGDIDVSAFLLGGDGKVSSDPDMVFYGQTVSGDGAVRLVSANETNGVHETLFKVATDAAALRVQRVAFASTLPGTPSARPTFGQAASVEILVDGGEPISFPVPVEGAVEAALILGELYRRDGAWKFRAIGQGFAGGLKPLAESFGVAIADPERPLPPAPAPTQPTPPSSVSPPPAPPKPVSLSKVTLSKASPSVDLTKKGAQLGEVRINLNWNRPAASGGFFSRGPRAVDLDLGCLFEMADGRKGVVQALGSGFGSFASPPYIELAGDDRSGAVQDGEWLRINGAHWTDIRRVLLFAFIYDGAPNWAATDGTVTVFAPDSTPIEVRLDEGDPSKRMCAVALLENVGGAMRITRQVRYFPGHRELDAAFGWGMRWTAGSKG